MKHVKLSNQTTIDIPTCWEDITLKQQLTVERLVSENEEEYKSLAIVAGYCNLTIDQVKKLHVNDIKKVLSQLTFIKSPISSDPISEFEYDGEKYFLIPTLLKGEFQDFLSIETLLENYKGKEYLALPYIIAIVAKKKNETLSDFTLESRAIHFENLPISIANKIWFFFALTAQLSIPDSQRMEQSNNQINESINSMSSTLKKQNGGGLLTRLLRVTLRFYLNFLKRNWNKYYSGLTSGAEKYS